MRPRVAVIGLRGIPGRYGGRVYLTQAIGAGIFVITGIQLLIAGLTLNVPAKMVRE